MKWRASILVVSLGCGSNACDRSPDAGFPGGGPPPDAAIDAPSDPATGVTVTVTLDGAPQPDIVVYFQSSYLGPSTELRTDASGSAFAVVNEMIYDVTSVTVVNPFGSIDAMTDELLTYNGVKAGDHIAVARSREPLPAVSFTLVAPADSPEVTRYQVHTNCGAADLGIAPSGTEIGGQLTLRGCGPTVDMLVESLGAAGQSSSWLYQPDVAISDGGRVELTGSYRPSHSRTFSYDTPFIEASQLEIHASLLTAKGTVYESPELVLPLSFMNDHPSLAAALPSIPGSVAVTETVYQSSDDGVEHVVDWGTDSDSYELDLSDGPFLEAYYSPPTLMGFGIGYTWFGGRVFPDYMRARLAVTRPGDRSWQWQFSSPPATFGGGTQPWPEIPSDVHRYNLQAGDVWSLPEATLVSAPGGYDAIRAQALSVVSPLAQLTGPSGRLVYETVLPR